MPKQPLDSDVTPPPSLFERYLNWRWKRLKQYEHYATQSRWAFVFIFGVLLAVDLFLLHKHLPLGILWLYLAYPLIALSIAGLDLWAIYRMTPERRRKEAGFCAKCGYDLRATPGRCPECGTIPPAEH
jgi:hypothetical protein